MKLLGQGPNTKYPRNQNIIQVFEAIVKKSPQAIAIEYAGQKLTYKSLNEKANQLARHLQKEGLQLQECVGVYLHRSIDLCIAILAILKAGGIYVPIDASYPLKRKLHMIEDTQLKILITHPEFASDFPKNLSSGFSSHEIQSDSKRIFDSGVKGNGVSPPLPRRGIGNTTESPEYQANKPRTQGKANLTLLFLKNFSYLKSNLKLKIDPLDLAYINYTSGTTGNPKGVQIPHRAVIHLVKNVSWNTFSPKDRCLQMSNISFDPLTQEIWGAFLNGATLVVYPETDFSPKTLGAFIAKEKISQIVLTSRVFTLLVEEALDCFKHVRFVGVGGDILSAKHAKKVLKKFPSCRVTNEYGPIENTTCSTTHLVSLKDKEPIPIGKPIDHTCAYILDTEKKLVQIGEVGELYLGGDGLARGYLHREDLTREKFIPNPLGEGRLYRTGDLARYLPDGNILFLGRMDFQVKIRGFRVELGEIEESFRNHPDIIDAAIVVEENKTQDKQLIAYLQLKKNISLAALRLFAKEHLPHYAIPHFFVILKKFPLTPNGKVDKKNLPLPKRSSSIEGQSKTETEKKLQPIWAQILNLQSVDRKDNFFEIGGDSIQAMRLHAKVSQKWKKTPVQLIFKAPTLEQYAFEIDQLVSLKNASRKIPFTKWRKKEAVLDPKIHAKHALPCKASQYKAPKKIFLTGATGLVGAFFLKHLLSHTKAKIYCLLRGTEESALEKLIQMATTYRIWNPENQKRITIVAGSLSEKLFGLEKKDFLHLGKEIDSIFHIGAFVNHAMGYPQHKNANVLGTEEILRLSCTHILKPVHFISSLSVLEKAPKNPVSESIDIDTIGNLSNGYAESKWIAEKLVWIGQKRGLLTNVFRLPRVGGSSEIGSGPTEDFLWRFMLSCIELQKAPRLDLYDDLTPIDYICKVIHHISQNPKWINHPFHVINPSLFPYKKLFQFLQKQGYILKWVDIASWKKALFTKAENTTNRNFQALQALFIEQTNFSEKPMVFSSSNLQKALKNTSISCPKIDEKLLTKYVQFYVETGFFPKPPLKKKTKT